MRAIFNLSRPGGLPTIWSSCLAGWWLGGAHSVEGLPWLFAGATLLYLGAAFLNDAFDVAHDRQWRRERPVPAGSIGLKTVWRAGLTLLAGGGLVLWGGGRLTGGLGLGLVCLIVVYNAIPHAFRPAVAGLCRWGLYALGASVARHGVTGWALWCGLAAGIYIAGAGVLAQPRESAAAVPAWPVLLLAVPILLAQVFNANEYREPALLLSAVLGIWLLRCARHFFWGLDRHPDRAREGLAAGIVCVDWLAACPVLPGHSPFDEPTRGLNLFFIGCFVLSLALYRAGRENAEKLKH